MTEFDATAKGGLTPLVKSTNANCAPVWDAMVGSCIADAPAFDMPRDNAANGLLHAPVSPVSARIVASAEEYGANAATVGA